MGAYNNVSEVVLPVGNTVLVVHHKGVHGMVDVIAQRRQQPKQQMDVLSQEGGMNDDVGAVATTTDWSNKLGLFNLSKHNGLGLELEPNASCVGC